jgi:hypothetical protein
VNHDVTFGHWLIYGTGIGDGMAGIWQLAIIIGLLILVVAFVRDFL